ncbi:hypothetical protein ASF98_10690 [Arthrobacter sp. Leaf337]|uniref:hypothetical protein n=1 Tax=Arthrobacter sp. Leaf337 TaxID=1736342 RepID=UPI0006F2DBDF|nr:hypothetical protein [Arthrobacter sp. Leaf337]KQR65561.1 hypothetical protein ASF98_10690 [Arthrobacter sp. Leaf337]
MGTLARRRAALLAAAALIAVAVAGCEYADDVGPNQSRPTGRPATTVAGRPVPLASMDPALEAELERNMAAVELKLADLPAGASGGAGSIGGHSSAGGGLTFSVVLTQAGTYTLTAICVGADKAKLMVTSRGAVSSSQGNDVLCGTLVKWRVELGTGPVTVHLVSPDEAGLHKAAVGVVRIFDPVPGDPVL